MGFLPPRIARAVTPRTSCGLSVRTGLPSAARRFLLARHEERPVLSHFLAQPKEIAFTTYSESLKTWILQGFFN